LAGDCFWRRLGREGRRGRLGLSESLEGVVVFLVGVPGSRLVGETVPASALLVGLVDLEDMVNRVERDEGEKKWIR
jgi:hypothetical protein